MDADAIAPARMQGVLRELRVTTETDVPSRLNFNVYRFSLSDRSFAFYSRAGLGTTAPFLAARDRVEVMAHGSHDTPDAEALVYALRNLEDGRIYFAHAIFRVRFHDRAMTVFTARAMREIARITGALTLATILLLGAIAAFAGSNQQWDLPLIVAAIAAAGLAAIALSYAIIRARWRLGWTTQRQRLTERVYAAFGLGPPVSPRLPPRVYEV